MTKNRKQTPNSRRRLQSIVILRSKSATKRCTEPVEVRCPEPVEGKLLFFYYFLQVELCKGL